MDSLTSVSSPKCPVISSSKLSEKRREGDRSARQFPTQRGFQSIGFRHKSSSLSLLPDSIISSPNHVFPSLNENNKMLLVWVLGFASSHIGMSAVRTKIISFLGETAKNLRLVGNSDWTLPGWWPGDNSGGDQIFPDEETAGRQIYRALYTIVSFITLGSAFGAYLQSAYSTAPLNQIHFLTWGVATDGDSFLCNACLATAALSLGAAIASLFNASPLGLMPGFESASTTVDITAITDQKSFGGFRRDDGLKFTTRGLTRITRHPLILPVVPWGFATGYLAGGRLCDYMLFGGLSVYAIAGCAAQDLRVMREEGSVGTVFRVNNMSDEKNQLTDFFDETSFVPFKAVFDGRQNIGDIIREVPWVQFFCGTLLGIYIEESVLQQLLTWSKHNIN